MELSILKLCKKLSMVPSNDSVKIHFPRDSQKFIYKSYSIFLLKRLEYNWCVNAYAHFPHNKHTHTD